MAIDPTYIRARFYLALKYIQLGRLAEAQFQLESAIKNDPLSGLANSWLVETYLLQRAWEKSRNLIKENLSRDPDSIEWKLDLAFVAYCETGDIEAYIEAVTEIPGSTEDPMFKIWNALHARQYREVLQSLEEVVLVESTGRLRRLFDWIWDTQPFHKQALTALLLFELGEREQWLIESQKLRTNIQAIMEEDPLESPDHWAFMAVCHALEGNREQMDFYISKTREVTSMSAWKYRHQVSSEMIFAIAYLVLGENELAIDILENASQLDGPVFLNRELDFWFMFDRLRGNPRFEALLED